MTLPLRSHELIRESAKNMKDIIDVLKVHNNLRRIDTVLAIIITVYLQGVIL